jgi:hypothetical protein
MVRRILKKMVSPFFQGRLVDIRPSDYMIVSYPRSGNTMLRYALAHILSKEEAVNYKTVRALIPDIYETFNYQLRKMPSPRYLKSHECFKPYYCKVLYLVRHPRDVASSYYHYKRVRNEIDAHLSFEEFYEKFLEGGIDRYGSWPDHVASWIGARGESKDFKIVKYEDLMTHKKENLREICDFLNIPVTEDTLDKVVVATSMENMPLRLLEEKNSLDKNYAPIVLSERQEQQLIQKAGKWLQRFKYMPMDMYRKAMQTFFLFLAEHSL